MASGVPLFKLIRQHLGSALEERGFRPATSHGNLAIAWTRPVSQNSDLELLFFRDHRPWQTNYLGNAFGVRVWLKEPAENPRLHAPQDLYFLVDEAERAEMRRIHDRVLSELPPAPDDGSLLKVESEGIDEQLELYRRKWTANHAPMMRYRTAEHVMSWLEFLHSILPRVEAGMVAPKS